MPADDRPGGVDVLVRPGPAPAVPRGRLVLVSAALAASGLVVAAPAPSFAVDGSDCTQIDDPAKVDSEPATETGDPVGALQVAEAQALATSTSGREPGAGVRVAVVDSGVRELPQIAQVADVVPPGAGVTAGYESYHGTAMAGIINGRGSDDVDVVGIAPAAEVVDVQVYDTDDEDDDELAPLTVGSLLAGLEALRPLVGREPGRVQVVNLSLSVPEPSAELEQAVRALTDAGAIVVASSGNREVDTGGGDDEPDGAYEFGEDDADRHWPAGYAKDDRNPRVVAVGTTAGPAEQDVPPGVLSSAIDVVVPTSGAVTYAVNGRTCTLYASSTSAAAATVSGVLALLVSAYPDDTPDQTIARLEATTTGGAGPEPAAPDTAYGRGIVQPVNALTSPVRPAPDGSFADGTGATTSVAPAPLPVPEPDVLAGTRRNAVWWGLLGGGALVVAMLLRPVLSRRRR